MVPATAFGRATWALLLGAAAVVPWVFTTRIDDVFYLPKLVALWAILAVIVWLLAVSTARDGPLPTASGTLARTTAPTTLVDGPIAAFVALNLCALAFSTDRHQSLFGEQLQHQGVLTLLLYIAYFYCARRLVRSIGRLTRLFGAVAIGATGVSLYAIAQRAGLDPIWKGYLPSGRVFSTIGQPNALAAYLVLAILVTATFIFSDRRSIRMAATAAIAVMVVSVLLTYSRGGYLGLAVAAIPMVVLALRERAHVSARTIALFASGAVLAIGLAVAAVAPVCGVVTSAWDRAMSVGAVSNDESIRNHLDTWKVAVRMIEDHPVLGTGPETFPEHFPHYSRLVLPPAEVSYFDQFRVESPHDEVLAVASGVGIPGATAYLAVLAGVAAFLVRAIRSGAPQLMRPALVAVLAAGLGHFITDSFMSAEVTGSWLFWSLLGAGVGVAESCAESRVAEAGAPHSELQGSELRAGKGLLTGSAQRHRATSRLRRTMPK